MSDEHPAPVEVLLPGFIVATANIQAGVPCLIGTRIPTYVGMGWVWESLDSPKLRRLEGLTREQIIALAAFDAGYEWHRSRKRRAVWEQAVTQWWDEYNRLQESAKEGTAMAQGSEGGRRMSDPNLINLEGAILNGISVNANLTGMRAGPQSEQIQRDIRDAITHPSVVRVIAEELLALSEARPS